MDPATEQEYIRSLLGDKPQQHQGLEPHQDLESTADHVRRLSVRPEEIDPNETGTVFLSDGTPAVSVPAYALGLRRLPEDDVTLMAGPTVLRTRRAASPPTSKDMCPKSENECRVPHGMFAAMMGLPDIPHADCIHSTTQRRLVELRITVLCSDAAREDEPVLQERPLGGPETSGIDYHWLSDQVIDGLSPAHRRALQDAGVAGDVPAAAEAEMFQVLTRAAAMRCTYHPDYDTLAARLLAEHWRRLAPPTFGEAVRRMHQHVHQDSRRKAPLISDEIAEWLLDKDNAEGRWRIEGAIKQKRDGLIPYAGLVKLRHSYLTVSSEDELWETPQYMWMRVALGIHGPQHLDSVIETYDLMSTLKATHATPTLINAGRPKAQMASCFLATVGEDSIEGIYDTLRQCARISQRGGGLGVSWSHVRAAGSYVAGCNGRSNGLVAWHRQYNVMVDEVDQGGGKRKGAMASYLEPWHADFPDWLDLKLPQAANEDRRARQLHYGCWVPDLLMKRAQEGKPWSLFCPNEAPGLCDMWGEEFEALYERYEKEGRARKTCAAADLLRTICERQVETGGPYLMYKDACNRKSNQQHLGTIRGSNLCTEIVQYASKDEMAVCNLASISLPRFVTRADDERLSWAAKEPFHAPIMEGAPGTGVYFDFEALAEVVRVLVRNLNRVIDRNYYPVPQARNSNLSHRPIALGVQGFADLLATMGFVWGDSDARLLNLFIFEAIYFAALDASRELAREHGKPYPSYQGSPASNGLLQQDLWSKEGKLPKLWRDVVPGRIPYWGALRERIAKYGLYNSLLVAPMPTVSTSKVLGNSAGIEPYHAHVYVEKALSGDVVHMTPGLVRKLIGRGLWTKAVRDEIIEHDGVLRDCKRVPDDLKRLYRTGWEIKLKDQVDMVADRAPYVDQSQSFNVWMDGSDLGKVADNLYRFHMYGWRRGLKTGSYYVRTRVQFGGQKFALSARTASSASVGDTDSSGSSDKTSDDSDLSEGDVGEQEEIVCPLRRPGDMEECEACGS